MHGMLMVGWECVVLYFGGILCRILCMCSCAYGYAYWLCYMLYVGDIWIVVFKWWYLVCWYVTTNILLLICYHVCTLLALYNIYHAMYIYLYVLMVSLMCILRCAMGCQHVMLCWRGDGYWRGDGLLAYVDCCLRRFPPSLTLTFSKSNPQLTFLRRPD